jgi:hypothetical protein
MVVAVRRRNWRPVAPLAVLFAALGACGVTGDD